MLYAVYAKQREGFEMNRKAKEKVYKQNIYSDTLGSYTGIPTDAGDIPIQDADDL